MPTLSLTLSIWRQAGPSDPGGFETHRPGGRLHRPLAAGGPRSAQRTADRPRGAVRWASSTTAVRASAAPAAFWSTARPRAPSAATSVCQLYLRQFRDGDVLTLEPFRARAFPVLQDLAVDRAAFDRIIAAGGYCSINTGSAPEANAMLIGREQAAQAFDAAACIGCGACVASCRNASASLFVAAKLAHLGQLPQGQPERQHRARALPTQMACGGLRQLQQPPGMRGRLPQADLRRLDQLDAPGGLAARMMPHPISAAICDTKPHHRQRQPRRGPRSGRRYRWPGPRWRCGGGGSVSGGSLG